MWLESELLLLAREETIVWSEKILKGHPGVVDTGNASPHLGSPTAGVDSFQPTVSLSAQLFLALTYLDFRCGPKSGRS